jgi:TolB-like protein
VRTAVWACCALALVVLSPAAAASAKLPDDPVAVLPFKNLNQDPALEWLRAGIAETMISDLKKSTTVRVVERDQIDRALWEIALQQKTSTEDATPVQVGKMVGAKTIVVGSFQQSGSSLRINARFVTVETGVVLDTAKTTGPSTSVFSLQDQVVDKLLGNAPAIRPKRKDSQKSLDAYRLYALALTVSSDADRVSYLKQSLALDPDFVYAADDLAALEARLGRYAEVRQEGLSAAEKHFWAVLNDDSATPNERTFASTQLLMAMVTERRLFGVIDASHRIESLHIPVTSTGQNATSFARFQAFTAYQALHQPDLAMQAGDRFLEDFPQDAWYTTVERQVRDLIEQRRRKAEGEERLKHHLATVEQQRADMISAHEGLAKRAGDPESVRNVVHIRMSQFDLDRCTFSTNADVDAWDQALLECQKFTETYQNDPDPSVAQERVTAEFDAIMALGMLGRWEQAIPRAQAFLAVHASEPVDSPYVSLVMRMRSSLDMWPSDAVPAASPTGSPPAGSPGP